MWSVDFSFPTKMLKYNYSLEFQNCVFELKSFQKKILRIFEVKNIFAFWRNSAPFRKFASQILEKKMWNGEPFRKNTLMKNWFLYVT